MHKRALQARRLSEQRAQEHRELVALKEAFRNTPRPPPPGPPANLEVRVATRPRKRPPAEPAMEMEMTSGGACSLFLGGAVESKA